MSSNGPSGVGEIAIDVSDVTYRHPGAADTCLERVSLRVEAGERLGILGPNGGGKTTLLQLLLGLSQPESGRIRLFGETPRAARRNRLVGYVPQRSEADLLFPVSVRDVVSMGVVWRTPAWRRVGSSDRARVDEVLELVGASGYADRPIGKLSGGQRQRALIACALAVRPRVLLLDEPMVGVDPAGQREFASLLADVHRRTGVTLVVVSHDIRAICAGCDRVACLSRTLHAHTSPEGLTPEVLAEVFSHDVAGFFGEVHVDAHLASECRDPSHQHHDEDEGA